jgi:hypothetical protein
MMVVFTEGNVERGAFPPTCVVVTRNKHIDGFLDSFYDGCGRIDEEQLHQGKWLEGAGLTTRCRGRGRL